MSARRAPDRDERQRDPERTRQALLDAARREFADKGLAGARVSEIAERAGVNKQLISYYFGGKQGLYDAITDEWLRSEREMHEPGIDLGELTCRYLAVSRDQPELHRLFVRESLEVDPDTIEPEPDDPDLVELFERQAAGEIAADLDPAFLLLVLQAAVSAGTLFPGDVKKYLGMHPDSPEFYAHADAQLRLIVERLAQGFRDEPSPPPAPAPASNRTRRSRRP